MIDEQKQLQAVLQMREGLALLLDDAIEKHPGDTFEFRCLVTRGKGDALFVHRLDLTEHVDEAVRIATELRENFCTRVMRNGVEYAISINENGEIYGWFVDADEGDPAATACFGTPEEDDEAEFLETARAIVAWCDAPWSLNDYAAIVHRANRKWWISIEDGHTRLKRNKGELLMLMVSEIAEAMEGERKNLMDDKLPHRRMAEVELADALIRIFDYAGAFQYDLAGAYHEKMAYNAVREDHTHEARRIAGGKQF